jgi:hypothetical protein
MRESDFADTFSGCVGARVEFAATISAMEKLIMLGSDAP